MEIRKGEAASDRDIVISRRFGARRELVFDAFTVPEMVQQWMLGPPGHTMPVCEIDLKVGGAWRYVWRLPDGSEMAAGGRYVEIIRPERIVHTELFDEDWTGGETLVTTLFSEVEGVTQITMTIRYASTEARDAALNSPMSEGMESGYQRLDAFLRRAA